MNSKFYWLIQNSWGEEACDHGFVKVEFGQIGVEQIAFAEPYEHKDIKDPQEIKVKFDSLDDLCFMKVSSNSSYDDWNNTLDIGFKIDETNKNFNFNVA